MTISLPRLLLLGVSLTLAACGGEGLTLPPDGAAAHIAVTWGNEQSARVSSRLPDSVVVKVTDTQNRPVADAEVVYEFTADGAAASPATVSTDANGVAWSRLTLGTRVGPVSGMVRVPVDPGVTPVEAEITAIAFAGDANGVALFSGNEQSGVVGTALSAPLVVLVTDASGNPIPNITIAWSIPSDGGGGSLSETSNQTGSNGQASVIRTLGPNAGQQSTLATAAELAGSPVIFTHTATAGSVSSVVLVSQDGQSALVNSELSVVVEVRDAGNNPITGASVTWVVGEGNGSVTPQNNRTDTQGRASAQWRLGPVPGSNTLNVVSGTASAQFRATGTAAPGPTPAQITENGGDGQSGPVNSTLATPLSVKVTSSSGVPVPGVPVNWTIGGGGSVSSPSSVTNAGGVAQVQRVLGSTPGTYTTTATVSGLSGSPVTFTSIATTGSASVLAMHTQPSTSTTVNGVFDRQPVVQLKDAAGNDVARSGVRVTAALESGDGTLEGNRSRTTDDNGRAVFTNLRINSATGSHTLIFAASNFQSATSDPIDVQKASTTTRIDSDNPEPSQPNQTINIGYTVSSSNGSPAGQVTVTASTGETCGGDVATGSCQITFATPGDRTLTASYAGDDLFNGSSSTPPTPHRVNAPPVANPDAYTTLPGGTLTVDAPGILGNDTDAEGDPVSAELVNSTSSGNLALDQNGSFTYQATAPGATSDNFTYRALDPNDGVSNEVTVTITIQ